MEKQWEMMGNDGKSMGNRREIDGKSMGNRHLKWDINGNRLKPTFETDIWNAVPIGREILETSNFLAVVRIFLFFWFWAPFWILGRKIVKNDYFGKYFIINQPRSMKINKNQWYMIYDIWYMIYIYIYIHKYIDGWMDGWIDDWARARAQVPKAQGPGAPFRALGQGPGAPYRALGPCALGTWARARAQSSIHPSIHLYIYEPMGHVRNHRIYFLIWGWGDKEWRICFSYLGIGI